MAIWSIVLLLACGVGTTLAQYKIAAGTPSNLTVSASNPNVNAITITPVLPYPQNAYYCNVTGDSRIPQQGPFPLTVYVPVGVTSTVIFANVTGPIPGTSCTGASVVQQSGSSTVVQQQNASSVVQQKSPSSVVQQSPSSVVQQSPGGSPSVVQQQFASINQQNPNATSFLNCVSNASSVVQQGPSASVVQQQSPSGTPSSVVQQQQTTTVVQQKSPPATVVQQKSPPTTPVSSVVQQSSSSASVTQTAGRHLLQAGTIEYISNNGSTGQPQLTVLDTVEGVPRITFAPTAVGQTATFSGALQVAKTTTNDGFGTPYIPYQLDPRLSPGCNVLVNFQSVAASSG